MKAIIAFALLLAPVAVVAQTMGTTQGYGSPSGYGTTTGYGSADGYASQPSPYLSRSEITSGNANKLRYAAPAVNASLMSPQAARDQYLQTHNPNGTPK